MVIWVFPECSVLAGPGDMWSGQLCCAGQELDCGLLVSSLPAELQSLQSGVTRAGRMCRPLLGGPLFNAILFGACLCVCSFVFIVCACLCVWLSFWAVDHPWYKLTDLDVLGLSNWTLWGIFYPFWKTHTHTNTHETALHHITQCYGYQIKVWD